MPLRLPAAARNPVSMLGVAIATAMATVFIGLAILEFLGYLANPYIGLLVFITVPAIFVAGLFLIPFGIWWTARRQRLRPDVPDWPVIDLGRPRQRAVLMAVLVLSLVNILIISLAAYGSVHYMESSEFCGQVCHTTMEPQYVAHQAGPHARVACAQCHVGPGAGALVESKMAGTRQLLKVLTNTVPTPVPTPAGLIQQATTTCQQCHWPMKVHGDVLRVIRDYANDEANTETVTTLRLHVGGGPAPLEGGAGIHWHMNPQNRIEYVATDAGRETIPYVPVTDARGTVREYLADGVDRTTAGAGQARRMDCIDCHSRPAHTFDPTPERAVDKLLASGRLPRSLPFVRREAVAAVKESHAGRAAGLDAIATRLQRFYAARPGSDPAAVSAAVAGVQTAWSRNVFPDMKVTWGTYVNQLGHVDAPGCFRCHDDSHKAADGRVIKQDCDLCHSMPDE